MTGDVVIAIDGAQILSADSVAALGRACDRIDERDQPGTVIMRLSGVPAADWADGLPTALFSKWERTLRRLECLAAVKVAVAEGDCGGPALDAFLVADYRIMTAEARLLLPCVAGATWPGMALYRLVWQAGAGQVRKAVLFGQPITAQAALATGLADELAIEVTTALTSVSGMAGAAVGAELAIRRQLMLEASVTSFEDALGVHLAACDRALRQVAAGTGQ